MHRSGTSALTASLQALGASLGRALVPANHDNPGGYFENAAAVTMHEALLAELGRGWEDLRALPEDWLGSSTARHAQAIVDELLASEFQDAPFWALKDPRLCLVLPLWRAPLAKAGVEAKCLFMLRDPDEVAASLGKRDGLGASHAYLLWLRYFLDAERDSRDMPRSLLTYDALLGDPVKAMTRVGQELDLEWPNGVDAVATDGVLDPQMHHHRRLAPTHNDAPRRAAIALYRRATKGIWPEGESSRALVQDWTLRLAPWLEGPANALARSRRDGQQLLQRCQLAEAALEEAKRFSLSRLDDVESLDKRLEATDSALDAAEAISRVQLAELRVLAGRVAETDAALEAAKALSMSRLDELHTTERRLAATDAALSAAEALSVSRLEELQALGQRLAKTDAALDAAKVLSRSRLEELQALGKRLTETDAALSAAEALSVERLEELQALGKRLAKTDAALDAAETLSMSRLDELQTTERRLAATDAALSAAEALSVARLEELQALGKRLADTDVALDMAKELSRARLEEVRSLAARVKETDRALEVANALSLSRLDDMQALSMRLAQTDEALATAGALAHSRLDEVRVLHGQVSQLTSSLQEARSREAERGQALESLIQRIADTEAALSAADIASQQARASEAGVQMQLQEADTALTRVRADRDEQLRALQAAGNALEEWRSRVEEAMRRIAELEGHLATVTGSSTWRLTAPLRWVGRHMGSGSRRGGQVK